MSGASSSSIPGDTEAAITPKADETVVMSLSAEAVEADLNHEQIVVERVIDRTVG